MIPKRKYILNAIFEKANSGTLTEEYIKNLIDKRWFIAFITQVENSKLKTRTVMPDETEGFDYSLDNIYERYTNKVTVVPLYDDLRKELGVKSIEETASELRESFNISKRL